MIEKEKLEEYAEKLMFRIKEEEYETLQKEVNKMVKQMDLIGEIKGIEDVEPMVFPFVSYEAKWREDKVKDELEVDEALVNAKDVLRNQVRVPKVVE